MDWIEEFEQKLNNGEITTDSQIEDFIDDQIGDDDLFGTFADSVWKTYYQWRAKGTPCEGCENASERFSDLYESACYLCSRRGVKVTDNYKKEGINS